jgi:hypothetical protein
MLMYVITVLLIFLVGSLVEYVSGNGSIGSRFSTISQNIEERTSFPLFSFKEDVSKLIEDLKEGNYSRVVSSGDEEVIPDETDLKILYIRYIESLKQYYWERFVQQGQEAGCNLQQAKRNALSEFSVAASKSTPTERVGAWNYMDYMEELETDIDSVLTTVAEAADDQGISLADLGDEKQPQGSIKCGKRAISRAAGRFAGRYLAWIEPKRRRRLKWVGSKAALLALNMAQFEWGRRQSVRRAEKRLAEVPEFPLL